MKIKLFSNNKLALALLFSGHLHAQYTFSSLDSLLSFSDRNSVSSKVSEQQSLLAKWTRIAALGNLVNYKSPISFSAIDNLLLPVNFLPAEAFGGPTGTFRQITLGQQYVSNFNFAPQIDIINPQNWARIKSARLNEEITELNNTLIKKARHESTAAAYYNWLALSEQISSAEKSVTLADSIYTIVKNKFDLGIARQQDVNNARANKLGTMDKLLQLKISLKQQLNAVKILCDIPVNSEINFSNSELEPKTGFDKVTSSLETKLVHLQNNYLKSELRAGRLSMLPVLSVFYYQGWQKNSNSDFFDNTAKWIPNKYLGLRITLPFPPEVGKLTQNYTNRVNYKISALNAEHVQLQNNMSNQNMELELEKARAGYDTSKELVELKGSNYEKSMNQYKEGILPVDLLFSAFSDLLNSRISLAAAKASVNYQQKKLTISNSFK